jgi:hypothetical protein
MKRANKRPRRGPKRGRGLQRQGGVYNVVARSSPANAPPFPRELSCKLYVENYDTIDSSTAQRTVIPLLEFLSRTPGKALQLYQLYNLCKITKIVVQFNIAQYGLNPFLFIGAVVPYSDALTISPADLGAQSGRKHRVIPLATRQTITFVLPAEWYFGNILQTSQYWINQTQAISASPVSTEEPSLCVLIQHPTGKQMQYVWDYTIEFCCQFFDEKSPSGAP